MIKKVLIGIVVLILGVLCFAATKPNTFHIERSVTINAPAERIYPMIAGFHSWPSWSPWEKLDPSMTRDVGGPEGQVGSYYAWAGNDKAGTGRMEVLEATPSSHVKMSLHFIKPFDATDTATFDLAPEGEGTKVTWSMDGPSPYMFKVMDLFMNMNATVGKEFDTGLANLKAQAEQAPAGGAAAADTTAKTL